MSLQKILTTSRHNITPAIQRVGKIPLLVVLLWLTTLWWGERSLFRQAAAACEWQRWESWPPGANPHHVLFVADPQLVDPHTYPGRPWPLSTLTVLYTDLYLSRTYRYLLKHAQPHTTMFLGDLFDGGREWAAADYKSPEDRYKKYGTGFWLKEYNRFMNMFIGGWYENNWEGSLTGEGRKIIASLPGNHDLGFAGGINEHVRNRFEAHFGPSNRVDVLGNHTFVSLDTVSLSAMDQVDPQTGGSGAGDGTGHDTKHMEIWKPVEQFLVDVKNRRAKAVQRRYELWKSLIQSRSSSEDGVEFKDDRDAGDTDSFPKRRSVPSSNFPTILLTHVPLFRTTEVTCGPFRERGNAIPLSAGYQYQNVLTPAVSKDIVDHLGADQMTMIYSGDDHDYCEIEHGEFTGQIKEITVKSMSWAMGVRKPGVQLASLWNPIDMDAIARGKAPTSTPRDTVQNHLCLLPDQLAIFIRYGQILALTLVVLVVRTILYRPSQAYQQLATSETENEKSQPLLPLSRKRTTPPPSPQISPVTSTITNNTSTPSHTARARSNGNTKLNGYGNIPSLSRSSSPNKPNYFEAAAVPTAEDTDDWGMPTTSTTISVAHSQSNSYSHSAARSRSQHRFSAISDALPTPLDKHNAPKFHAGVTAVEKLIFLLSTPATTKLGEFYRSFNLVAGPVLMFYFWLLWNG